MNTCLIIAGGSVDEAFAAGYLKGKTYGHVIAADSGLETAGRLGLMPTAAVGDFDSVSRETYACYAEKSGIRWDVHKPEKDETDMELALAAARARGCGRVEVIGATGGRMDHTLSNIQSMLPCLRAGVQVTLVDHKNRVFLLDKGRTFLRSECFGKYISFLPLTERVTGITLKGFKYPLNGCSLEIGPSLMISNELVREEGSIEFTSGVLICVESRD